MKFRHESQHHQCATCLRHKAMIRALSGHSAARAKQQKLFHEHLCHQYQDRLRYWSNRGESRQRGLSVCLITDGMDQGKWSLPRSEYMRSKEFATFQRPRTHVSALIIHGWCQIYAVSDSNMPKDSNASVELLAHGLTVLKQMGAPLHEMHIGVQSDNTCREVKNSQCLRFLGALVSGRIVRSSSLSCLRSGHSHEDIDQCFGWLSKFSMRCRRLQTPGDVVDCIEAWLKQAKLPEERRLVVRIEQTRDWPPGLKVRGREWYHCRQGFYSAAIPVALKGVAGPGAPHHFLLERRSFTGQLQS